ncbi:MAG: cytochrome d ubiquinol oxidase subunit II [Actinomycetaceae bacterium]|nr:cytochrome d ubiquinol oxidase subunit II [Actinomycetaceae bacterium]MDY6083306.1 cytochrome d ubiquinol oxidase subunit II [Actinomycetaceae bacterium]
MTPIQFIWFVLIAVLWIGYLALEGFDFGVGMLLKIVAKNEKERRAALNTIGPHWDGNEVWLLTAGGATFAAFPEWYATMFSGMYLALVVILLCLILRIAAIEWRKSISSPKWHNFWDNAHVATTWIVSILWGVAFANLVQGMPIEVGHYVNGEFVRVDPASVNAEALADNMHFFTGNFFSLLTPFTILGGLVTMTLFLTQGALFLSAKTTGDLHERAQAISKKSTLATTVVVAIWALWAQFAYANTMWALIPLVITALLLVATMALAAKGDEVKAFICHFAAIAFAVVFIWFAVFPDAMKSNIDPAYSLTLAQAAATTPTQIIMVIAAVVFVPIVLAYTIWAYIVFAGRVDATMVPDEPAGLDYKNVRSFAAQA